MALPGLAMDDVTVSRPQTSADSEGNTLSGFDVIATVRGTWGSPSSREADAFSEHIDGVLAISSLVPVSAGDRVETRGNNWDVVHVRPLRTHQRVFMRRR